MTKGEMPKLTFSTLSRMRELAITTVQTLIIVAIAFVITIFQCKFDIKNFNWLRFAFNFLFSTSMKVIYTRYAKTKEMENPDIVLLKNTVDSDRKDIFNEQKTQEFDDEIDRRNKIARLDSYIAVLDSKKPRAFKEKKRQEKIKLNASLRDWAFNYKTALENEEDTENFEKQKTIGSLHVWYEKIESSKLFTYGKSNKLRKKKYSFSAVASSLNRSVVPVTVSLIISVIFGTIQNNSEINGQLWIDLMGYLFSIGMGVWWGLSNGKSIIQEDYFEVLTNVSMLVRDVKKKIGVKGGI